MGSFLRVEGVVVAGRLTAAAMAASRGSLSAIISTASSVACISSSRGVDEGEAGGDGRPRSCSGTAGSIRGVDADSIDGVVEKGGAAQQRGAGRPVEGGVGLGGGLSAVHLGGHRREAIRGGTRHAPTHPEAKQMQVSRQSASKDMRLLGGTDLPIPLPPPPARLSRTPLALSSWGHQGLPGSGIGRRSTMAMSWLGKEPALVGACACGNTKPQVR